MKTPRFSLPSRLSLLTSLLAGLLISGSTTGARPIALNERPDVQPETLNVLTIPEVPAGLGSPKANGTCDETEYAGGLFVTFPDGPDGTGTGHVYLVHDANYLYMCITSPMGSYRTRFDSLYLDPQGDGTTYTYAQQDDFSLRLDYSGGRTTFRGSGVIEGWQDSSAADN